MLNRPHHGRLVRVHVLSNRLFGYKRRTILGKVPRQERQHVPGRVSEVRHSAGIRDPGPQLLSRYKLGTWE
jgi:hypothetical protein